MSALSEQVRRLRIDAGIIAGATLEARDHRRLDALRQLVRSRETLRHVPLAAPAGEEIAPGVRYVEGDAFSWTSG